MDISKLNKAEVLRSLYNNAKPQGMGFLLATKEDMTLEQAEKLLEESNDKYFDYIQGRVLKVRIKNELDTWLYNRDNGDNAAENVINKLLSNVNENGTKAL